MNIVFLKVLVLCFWCLDVRMLPKVPSFKSSVILNRSVEIKVLTFATVLNKKPNDIVRDVKNDPVVTTESYDCNVIENHAG